jgi:hypothetical protein
MINRRHPSSESSLKHIDPYLSNRCRYLDAFVSVGEYIEESQALLRIGIQCKMASYLGHVQQSVGKVLCLSYVWYPDLIKKGNVAAMSGDTS